MTMHNEILEVGQTIHLSEAYHWYQDSSNNLILIRMEVRGSYSEAWLSQDSNTGNRFMWYANIIEPTAPIRINT